MAWGLGWLWLRSWQQGSRSAQGWGLRQQTPAGRQELQQEKEAQYPK